MKKADLMKIIDKINETEKPPITVDYSKNNKELLDNLQKINNKLFDKHGLNDDVLALQLFINESRHELDIVDENDIILTDDEGNSFVQ